MEKKNNNVVYKTITIILLIIIIIFLLFFNRFGELDNKENNLVPTGNVDVFDIDINCKCENNECIVTDRDGRVVPIFDEVEDKEKIGTVFVDDKVGNYLYQERLRIFNNAAYEFQNKIAPGVSNVYHFVVHNSTNEAVSYRLQMYEESEYPINMVYRLKNDNNFVVGNSNKWVSANELNTALKKLNRSTSDNYSLEWKWLYEGNDEADNNAGINMESEYKLNIRVYFEDVNA